MTDTTNHLYNVPPAGTPDWHAPLNENFEAFEVDIPLLDGAGARTNYTPHNGAWYLASDTGAVYTGDGSTWSHLASIPKSYERTASGDGTTTTFTLAHSLFATPTGVQVTPESADAAGEFWVSAKSAGDITITYASAPPSGTDNLAWNLSVEA